MNNFKTIFSAIFVFIVLAVIALVIAGGVGKNDTQNWQIVQSINGDVSVRSEPGYYLKWFATVWTYPKYIQYLYNVNPNEGEAADERSRVTFNDGGTALVADMIVIATPVESPDRIEFHNYFRNDLDAIKVAVRGYKTNVMKATASLMSATENQSARKAEFQQLIEAQLTDGLFEMRRTEKVIKDQFDETGKPITVPATEIILKEGKPVIASLSPLIAKYKMSITQYSVEDIDYDEKTREQFAAKKGSYLQAEQAKAEREQMVQERLMIVEKFEKEKAEVTGEANKVKAKAVIEAQQKAEVAMQIKQEAETKAKMAQAVAEISKQEEAAKLEAAQLAAQRIKVTAEAEKEAIQLAGKMTEVEQYQLDTEVKKVEALAKYLPGIQMPSVIMNGSGADGKTGNTTDNLINITLMRELGLMDVGHVNKSDVKERVIREPQALPKK